MSNSVIPLILSELQSQYGIAYDDVTQLQDESGEHHTFYIASMYEAKILVDTDGQLWMNEAELGRVIGVSKGMLHNAMSRFIDTDLGQAVSKVYPLYTLDRRGRRLLMNFYNEATIALVIGGFKNHTQQAITFIQEREAIISGIRKLMHNYSLHTNEQNFQLVAKVENLNAALSEETNLRLSAEWEAQKLQMEKAEQEDLKYDYLRNWEPDEG